MRLIRWFITFVLLFAAAIAALMLLALLLVALGLLKLAGLADWIRPAPRAPSLARAPRSHNVDTDLPRRRRMSQSTICGLGIRHGTGERSLVLQGREGTIGIRARAEVGMNSAAVKSRLRKSTLLERDALNIDDRLSWDEAIIERVLALPQVVATKGPVAGYWQMRSEVDIRPVLADLSKRGVQTCLPAIVDDELSFRN